MPVVESYLESFYYSAEGSQIGETNDGITPLPVYMVSTGEIPTQCLCFIPKCVSSLELGPYQLVLVDNELSGTQLTNNSLRKNSHLAKEFCLITMATRNSTS